MTKDLTERNDRERNTTPLKGRTSTTTKSLLAPKPSRPNKLKLLTDSLRMPPKTSKVTFANLLSRLNQIDTRRQQN